MSHSFKEDPYSDLPNPHHPEPTSETSRELLLKELNLNEEERSLLLKRIKSVNDLMNNLPSSDPQYPMLKTQSQMDQIEIDELKRRAQEIKDLLITI